MAKKRVESKGEKRAVNVLMDKDLYKEMKMYVIDQNETMARFVADAVYEKLVRSRSQKKEV